MTSERPLVSAVIPNYNYGDFIGNAIRSVFEQTYANVEVIVVDNFSTDHSMAVLAGIHDPRLRVFQFNNRGLIAAGRNFGASKATGEVLGFLDADDRWLPTKLETQVPHLRVPGVAGVATDFIAAGDVLHHKHHLSFVAGAEYRDYNAHEIARLNSIMTSSIIVRAADFSRLGGFDENNAFRFIEDWELWLRLAHAGDIRVLNSKLIEYRICQKKDRDMRDISLATLRVLEKHHRLGLIDGPALDAAYGSCYLLIARAYLDRGDWQGLHYYRQGLSLSKGMRNKFRAAAGMALYFMPTFLRKAFLEVYYHMPAGYPS